MLMLLLFPPASSTSPVKFLFINWSISCSVTSRKMAYSVLRKNTKYIWHVIIVSFFEYFRNVFTKKKKKLSHQESYQNLIFNFPFRSYFVSKVKFVINFLWLCSHFLLGFRLSSDEKKDREDQIKILSINDLPKESSPHPYIACDACIIA